MTHCTKNISIPIEKGISKSSEMVNELIRTIQWLIEKDKPLNPPNGHNDRVDEKETIIEVYIHSDELGRVYIDIGNAIAEKLFNTPPGFADSKENVTLLIDNLYTSYGIRLHVYNAGVLTDQYNYFRYDVERPTKIFIFMNHWLERNNITHL